MPTGPPESFSEIGDFNKELAAEVRAFLGSLADTENLAAFVNDRIGFMREQGLSSEAQALLLDSNFARINAVMSAASPPQRWLVVWIV